MPQTKLGIEYEVLQPGSGAFGQFGSIMTVHLTAAPHGGPVLMDTRQGGQPLTYVAGRADVMAGLDLSAAVLQAGSTVRLIIPPEYGLGEEERDGLPAGSTLEVTVEVLKVEHQAVDDSQFRPEFVDPRALM